MIAKFKCGENVKPSYAFMALNGFHFAVILKGKIISDGSTSISDERLCSVQCPLGYNSVEKVVERSLLFD